MNLSHSIAVVRGEKCPLKTSINFLFLKAAQSIAQNSCSRFNFAETIFPSNSCFQLMLVEAAPNGYFCGMKTFGPVLESIEELPIEDQELLMTVMQKRMAERRRNDLIEGVIKARAEFRTGKCRSATPNEIMKKILA